MNIGSSNHPKSTRNADTPRPGRRVSSAVRHDRAQVAKLLKSIRSRWRQVEVTMLREPLEEVAKRGPQAVRKRVERDSVSKSLGAFSTSVRALVAHASPARGVPVFDEGNQDRLVDVFCCAHAPEPDILVGPDYAALCRHAKHLAQGITGLAHAAKARNADAATRHLAALRPRWQAYLHHNNRWQAAVAPRQFTLGSSGAKLTETALHQFLLYPNVRFQVLQEDWLNIARQLTRELNATPRVLTTTYEMLALLHASLREMYPQNATLLESVFDLDGMKQMDARGVFTSSVVFGALKTAMALLNPSVVHERRLARYADCDDALLADALVDAARLLSRARGRSEHTRLRGDLPAALAAGILWERNNFADRLRALNGRCLRTERWMERTPLVAGESLRSWQARAVTALLLHPEAVNSDCPETLILARRTLQKAQSVLDALGRASAGELRFVALLRMHGASPSPQERLALQRRLMEVRGPAGKTGPQGANVVVVGVAAALRAHGHVVLEEDLLKAHGDGLVADLTDFSRRLPDTCRARLGERFARELVTPSLNDDPNEVVTPILLRLQQLARDLRRLLDVDMQVHGDYYQEILASRFAPVA